MREADLTDATATDAETGEDTEVSEDSSAELDVEDTGDTVADTAADTGTDTVADTMPETDTTDTSPFVANGCGGAADLSYLGRPAAPGDGCGLCGDGELFCSGTSDLSCAGAGFPNVCGGCGALEGEIGASCGLCDDGVWACGAGQAECLGDRAPNGCGGCTDLALEPGTECGLISGEAGVVVCYGREISQCASAGTNGCGGTGPLELPAGVTGVAPLPGVLYQTDCRRGVLLCEGLLLVAVDLEGGNACGGCEPLPGAPGTACGACGGVWTCDAEGGAQCVGGALNGCGGCELLADGPGITCDAAGSPGVRVCISLEETACVPPGSTNACGGLGTLTGAALGGACGSCGDGVVVCDAADPRRRSTVCETVSSSANACGGCGLLEGAPGSACGTCGLGQLACNAGGDGLDCTGNPGASALNACGGCASLAAAPADACGRCGTWECDPTVTGRLRCDEPTAGCASLAVCGNGVVEIGELCDDGNAVTEACSYGDLSCEVCDATCALLAGATAYCGDGSQNGAEVCDDGAANGTAACSVSCTCESGYHLEGGACTNNERNCDVLNGTGRQLWDGAAYGACSPTACNSTYHFEDSVCMSNTRNCVVPNGAGLETWNGSDYGACTPNTCNPNYHLEAGVCTSNIRNCVVTSGIGVESWTGSGYDSCVVALCDAGHILQRGACVPDLLPLGEGCTTNSQCASNFCAIAPDGTANDRCAPSDMVWVPSGAFTMGSPTNELGRNANESPRHTVTISRAFFVDRTEVMQGAWKALSGGLNPSCWQSTAGYDCSTIDANNTAPVEQVDWYSPLGFANARSAAEGLPGCYTFEGCTDPTNGWRDGDHGGCTGVSFAGVSCAGYRLPTESEWEYAARAGTSTATFLGSLTEPFNCITPQANLDGIAWWCGTSGNRPSPVGVKDANPWGLRDVLGNVAEWTWDWYDAYPSTVTDPLGPSLGTFRVLRGGYYFVTVPGQLRAAARSGNYPDRRERYVGFRLVRTVPPLEVAAGVCGNGVLESGEGCDDGNAVTELCAYGDRACAVCDARCRTVAGAYCGDGSLDASETCDDGATNGSGACTVGCTCAPGYHLEGGVCSSDERACLVPNGTGAESWTGSSYGACVATGCDVNFRLVAGACVPKLSLGIACTSDGECASNFCATAPVGTANDRCAPAGMVWIPSGTFTMGSPASELGRGTDETQHVVRLSRSFFLDQTEVTQRAWTALSGGVRPASAPCGDTCPVSIDWYSAVAFANVRSAAEGLAQCYTLSGCDSPTDGWRGGEHFYCTDASFVGLSCSGYRLPTESEWEYAARASTTTATSLGNLSGTVNDCSTSQPNLDRIAWWCLTYSGLPSPVGTKESNGWGLHDMLGNLMEWTWDRESAYPGTVTDPLGETSPLFMNRVIRGGVFFSSAQYLRSAARNSDLPSRRNFTGVRLARTVP